MSGHFGRPFILVIYPEVQRAWFDWIGDLVDAIATDGKYGSSLVSGTTANLSDQYAIGGAYADGIAGARQNIEPVGAAGLLGAIECPVWSKNSSSLPRKGSLPDRRLMPPGIFIPMQ